jgi:predicted phosphoribosyltransferase
MKATFRDRRDAGRVLAAALLSKTNLGNSPVVVALPRGGVPVGFEVAAGLNGPLDVCVVRQVEIPNAGGILNLAIASGRVIMSESKRAASTVSEQTATRIAQKEGSEISRRERAYRGEHPEVRLSGRTVVLVDDGLGAPEPFVAAVAAVRARGAARVVVAVPVAASSSYRQLFAIVDDLVCLDLPQPFHGVGASYADFSEVSDPEVRALHEAASVRAQRAFLD